MPLSIPENNVYKGKKEKFSIPPIFKYISKLKQWENIKQSKQRILQNKIEH